MVKKKKNKKTKKHDDEIGVFLKNFLPPEILSRRKSEVLCKLIAVALCIAPYGMDESEKV